MSFHSSFFRTYSQIISQNLGIGSVVPQFDFLYQLVPLKPFLIFLPSNYLIPLFQTFFVNFLLFRIIILQEKYVLSVIFPEVYLLLKNFFVLDNLNSLYDYRDHVLKFLSLPNISLPFRVIQFFILLNNEISIECHKIMLLQLLILLNWVFHLVILSFGFY